MSERSRHIIIFFVLFCMINYCESAGVVKKFGIVGGQETHIQNYPYQCGFFFGDKLKCGCSLISSKCILTAAHCTNQFNTDITIRVGSTHKDSGGDVYTIKEIIEHPDFEKHKLRYDFSILIPNEKIVFDNVNSKPITLPKLNQVIEDETNCVVSGFGKADNDTRPDKLRSVDVKVVNRQTCQECYNSPKVRFKIADEMLCAGWMSGGKDACTGDSGGPLVCTVDGEKLQFGVVSSGYGCAVKDFPGIYANVAKVRDWIDSNCL